MTIDLHIQRCVRIFTLTKEVQHKRLNAIDTPILRLGPVTVNLRPHCTGVVVVERQRLSAALDNGHLHDRTIIMRTAQTPDIMAHTGSGPIAGIPLRVELVRRIPEPVEPGLERTVRALVSVTLEVIHSQRSRRTEMPHRTGPHGRGLSLVHLVHTPVIGLTQCKIEGTQVETVGTRRHGRGRAVGHGIFIRTHINGMLTGFSACTPRDH